MSSCRDVDAVMTAYVDGETTAAEAAEVDAHLAACPGCRDRVKTETTMRTVVRATATTLGERASPALRARCVAALPGAAASGAETGRRGGRLAAWMPLSMAATVLLAVGAVFLLGQNERLEAAFAAQLAKDHDKCFAHQHGLDPDYDAARAEAVLRSDFGIASVVPRETASFDVIDVRQCEYDGGGMAHVLCEWNGEPVSLFVVPGRTGRERHLETMGHDAIIWSQGDAAFAIVAEQGPVEIDRVAEYIRAAARRSGP